MIGGSAVDGRLSVGGVLRYVWRDPESAQFPDKWFRIVAFVAAKGYPAGSPGELLHHGLCRFAFAGTRCCCHLGSDDETTAILHQGVPLVAELGFFGLPLAVELGIGIGDGSMGFVSKLLSLEVHRLVSAATTGRRWPILGFEALDGGPGFDEGTVNGKVLAGQKALAFRLGQYPGQELSGNLGTDQPFAVLGKAGMVPDLLFQAHAEEPAEQEVVVDLFHQLPVAADGIENHQQLGLQELLRRDRRSAGCCIHAVKELVHPCQGFIGHLADGTQGMILRDKGLRCHIREESFCVTVETAHNFPQ